MEKIRSFLKNNIDIHADCKEWNTEAKKILSLYLAGSYEFYCATILGMNFLLMKPYETDLLKKQIRHIRSIEEASGMPAALLMEQTSSYRLKKMLQEKVAFVLLEGQMYLPFMALRIRKQKELENTEIKECHVFTPITQMIYLWILYHASAAVSAELLVEKLSISAMSASRGLKELQNLQLVNCAVEGKTGRKKVFSPIVLNDYYKIGKKYLQNPVRKTIYISDIPTNLFFCKSDLTALAEQTMLGESNISFYAVDGKKEDILLPFQISEEQAKEEGLPCIQLMRYNIAALAENGYEDPISLILGLSDRDERIDMAIEELMEEKSWYQE